MTRTALGNARLETPFISSFPRHLQARSLARALDHEGAVQAEIILHRAKGLAPEALPLARMLSIGGGARDAVRVEGAAPGSLLVHPSPAGPVVEAGAIAVRIGDGTLARGERRLLRPGERAECDEFAIVAPRGPARDEATRVLAGALLRDAAHGAIPPPAPHLVVVSGARAGQRLSLGPEQTIGRGARATLRLPDARASRVHARIRMSGSAVLLEDVGSKNGSRVNGAAVGREGRSLRDGDEIALGSTALTLVIPFAPDEDEPRAPPAQSDAVPPAQVGAERSRRPRFALLAAAGLLAATAVALAVAAL